MISHDWQGREQWGNRSTGRVGLQEGIPGQARLDFTPAASELAHALRGRETRAQRIMARFRLGPATTWDLVKAGGVRFGARLQELEARGMQYTREDFKAAGNEHSVYTMTREPGNV